MTPYEALLARYAGVPMNTPVVSSGPKADPRTSGSQDLPLEIFYGAAGSGNKTTNKDLPEWLRRAGMKGDAYAGGMLKPELRYGFMYKNGKIYFADGTSYAAKKGKGGTYTYTDASGAKQTYSPTDEQNAYNKRYKKATTGFFDNFTNSLSFDNNASPFGEAGLMFDPIYHATGGDDGAYARIMRESWETPNEVLAPYAAKFHQWERENPWLNPLQAEIDKTSVGTSVKQFSEAKPADTIFGIIAGSALAGGMGGGAGAGASGGSTAGGFGGATGMVAPGSLSSAAPLAGGGASAAGGAASLGAAALPEIVVTGTVAGSGAGGALATGGAASLGYFGNNGADGMGTVGQGNVGQLNANTGINTGGVGGVGGTPSGLGGSGGSGMNWMDWVDTAVNVGSALYSGDRANDAVRDASREGIAENRRQFDLVRADTAGQRALGNAAIGSIASLYGYDDGTPDMGAFFTSPDYQFNLAEGQKAIDRSAAARGGLLSGAAVKEGMRYGSGLASREYSSFVDRLLQQAGIGATGIGASAAAGANSAGNISSITQNAGNARASIYSQTGANVNNAYTAARENHLLRRYLGEG